MTGPAPTDVPLELVLTLAMPLALVGALYLGDALVDPLTRLWRAVVAGLPRLWDAVEARSRHDVYEFPSERGLW